MRIPAFFIHRTFTQLNTYYQHGGSGGILWIYLRASGTTQLDNETQTATIINCGGEQLLKIYDNFT